jgi:flavin-dependent dehydrogenase
MKRVVIAGGGLAGLSLGVALRRQGVPVELHEAGVYPRHRVCGEFISGVEDQTLDELGVRVALDDAERLETAVWSDRRGEIGRMGVQARGVSRWRLDERLRILLVAEGGVIHERSRWTEDREGVVWASGRPRKRSPWLGLKGHVHELPMDSDLEMFVGSNGYVGLARIEEGKVNVCGLFRSSGRGEGRGAALLVSTIRRGGLDDLADRLQGAQWDESSVCGVAGFHLGRQTQEGFCLGDAAQMIPPFTGNGMSMAFESAALAVEPAVRWSQGRMDWVHATRTLREAQERKFRRRMRSAQTLHAFLTSRWGTVLAVRVARLGVLPYEKLLNLVR